MDNDSSGAKKERPSENDDALLRPSIVRLVLINPYSSLPSSTLALSCDCLPFDSLELLYTLFFYINYNVS